MQRPLGLTVLVPRARQTKDLRQSWPGGVVIQVGRGDEVPRLARRPAERDAAARAGSVVYEER
jgi:hypothetical protein